MICAMEETLPAKSRPGNAAERTNDRLSWFDQAEVALVQLRPDAQPGQVTEHHKRLRHGRRRQLTRPDTELQNGPGNRRTDCQIVQRGLRAA